MGELIRDRYELLELVGRGAQGEVWRALDHQHGRTVALKERRVGSDADRAALLGEARVLLALRPHAALPLVREDFFSDDRYFLAMDWIEGRDLREVLEDEGSPGLAPDRVLALLAPAAAALDHLHSHTPPVVHRDVKPANIVVAGDGHAVLVDFGISTAATGAGIIYRAGTPGYIAPELLDAGVATPASDVFALAATAFTLLTGGLPVAGRPPDLPGVAPDRGERIRRVLARGLAADPARRPRTATELLAGLAPAAPRGNLPAALARFVGREREIAQVGEALSSGRIVTLTGPGGIGKTRLALEVAALQAALFAGGAWLVRLDAVDDQLLVPQQIATALGVRDEPGRPLIDSVCAHLRPRKTLVVLDTCERLIDACASAAVALLESCPDLRILATSRERLSVPGETEIRVGSLATPTTWTAPSDLARLESVALFIDRATVVRPSFRLSRTNASAVASICTGLDGIPLAIELAAARCRELSPSRISARLDDRLRMLTGGNRCSIASARCARPSTGATTC